MRFTVAQHVRYQSYCKPHALRLSVMLIRASNSRTKSVQKPKLV